MFINNQLYLNIIGFQSPATTVMEAIVSMHHYVFFYLILVFIFVIYIYLHILYMYQFIPTYLYDISYKFNDESIIFIKFIRLFIQLFLNFEFFSSYIIYFSQRQAISFGLKDELYQIIQAQYQPAIIPYRQFPQISDIIDTSEIIFVYRAGTNNEQNNISLELSNLQQIEKYEIEEDYNLVFQFYQNLPLIIQIAAYRRQEQILITRLINHHSILEIIQTLIPSFFLFLIALPSFALLYEFDEILAAAMTFKVIGYQQFQTYEVLDLYLNNIKISNLKDILYQLETKDVSRLSQEKEIIANSDINYLSYKALLFTQEGDNNKEVYDLGRFNNCQIDLHIKEVENQYISKFLDDLKVNQFCNQISLNLEDQAYIRNSIYVKFKDQFYVNRDFDFISENNIEYMYNALNQFINDKKLLNKEFVNDQNFIEDQNDILINAELDLIQSHLFSIYILGDQLQEFIEQNNEILVELEFTDIIFKLLSENDQTQVQDFIFDNIILLIDLEQNHQMKSWDLFERLQKITKFRYQNIDIKQLLNSFDSVMIPEENLMKGQKRLLEVDNPLVLPFNYIIQAIITAGDVLHSQAVPSFGVKVDAVPGRLNQVQFLITRPGTFYGQCSELCGVNHGFMPIVIKVPFIVI